MATKEGWIKRRLNGNDIPWNKGMKFGKSSNNKRIFIKCIECNNNFEIKLYRKNTAHFCSQECAHKNRCKSTNYNSIHKWINFHLGSAKKRECRYCGSNIWVEWASISHKAKRDINDYIELCRKCHRKYDLSNKNNYK